MLQQQFTLNNNFYSSIICNDHVLFLILPTFIQANYLHGCLETIHTALASRLYNAKGNRNYNNRTARTITVFPLAYVAFISVQSSHFVPLCMPELQHNVYLPPVISFQADNEFYWLHADRVSINEILTLA